jgi:hypothetical protein
MTDIDKQREAGISKSKPPKIPKKNEVSLVRS